MRSRALSIVIAVVFALGISAMSQVAAQVSAAGQIAGQVNQKCGRPLGDDLQAQLVDANGVAVPGMRVPVDENGKFVFNNVPQGTYTVQIINPDGTQGMSAITMTGRLLNAIVTIGTGACGGFWNNKTAVVLVGAAAAGGTFAIVATAGEASPSR